MRLAAYRQFTIWVYDRLGKHNRQVIPACVVNKIRQTFPRAEQVLDDDEEQYIGFKLYDEWPVY